MDGFEYAKCWNGMVFKLYQINRKEGIVRQYVGDGVWRQLDLTFIDEGEYKKLKERIDRW